MILVVFISSVGKEGVVRNVVRLLIDNLVCFCSKNN